MRRWVSLSQPPCLHQREAESLRWQRSPKKEEITKTGFTKIYRIINFQYFHWHFLFESSIDEHHLVWKLYTLLWQCATFPGIAHYFLICFFLPMIGLKFTAFCPVKEILPKTGVPSGRVCYQFCLKFPFFLTVCLYCQQGE